MNRLISAACFAALLTSLAACGGAGGKPPASVGCGSPLPSAPPDLSLVYPVPSATAVRTTIGVLIFAHIVGSAGKHSITLTTGGRSVPVGALTAPPSPLPSPRVTPGGQFNDNVFYVAAPVPTLSPLTTYTVQFTYEDWADNPPSCETMRTKTLGTFTTQ